MNTKDELPEQISYLKSVIEKLDAFDPESLGDDNPDAMDIVESAIRERLRGVSPSEAEATLQGDLDILNKWLSDPELESSSAFYIVGAFEGLFMYGNPADLSF